MSILRSKLKSNQEIITWEASKKGFNYTGDNLFTYGEWLCQGYRPVRGQRAFIKTYLWTLSRENKKKTLVGLFTIEQVERLARGESIVV